MVWSPKSPESHAMLRPMIRYADFKGRASRREYWGFALLQIVWYLILIFIAAGALGQSDRAGAAIGVSVVFGAIGLSALALIVPNYAVLTRRLHDSGRGAVWLCLMLPSVASSVMTIATLGAAFGSVGLGASRDAFVGLALSGLGAAGLLGLIGILCQAVLFVLTLLPGTHGDNRFGPDPRDPSASHGGSGGGFSYDEDRLEELFAQAKRDSRAAEAPYKPVFDFGPGPIAETPPPAPRPIEWGQPAPPAWDPGAAPSRPFGRRT